MFMVEIEATLGTGRRLTDDEISDLIEHVVDDLDRLAVSPSIGTQRVGDDLRVEIGVTVDEPDELDALASALALVKSAFAIAGMGARGAASPRGVRSRVGPQPA
jgi:hypothetical protein